MKKIDKRTIKFVALILLFFSTAFILLFNSYQYIEKTLIHNEEEKIKTTAVNASKTMEVFFLNQIEDLNLIFHDQYLNDDQVQSLVDTFTTTTHEAVTFELIDDWTFSTLPMIQESAYYLTCELVDEHQYDLILVKPIIVGSETKHIIERINLNILYNSFLSSIQLGEMGYSTMKDENGIILMHGVLNEIGVDSRNDRKSNFSELNSEGIDELVSNQLSGKVGCDTVLSYWWGQENLGRVKKLIGYAPFYLNDHMFVLNVIVSYDEVTAPIRTLLQLFLLVSILLLIILSFSFYTYAKNQKDFENLQLKMNYENEISLAKYKLDQQIFQAMKSEKLNALGFMSSSISHEIRNLITPILLYSEMLKSSLSTQEDITSMEEIYDLASRCNELTTQLTMYSRTENDELTMDSLDLNATVQTSCKMIQNIMPSSISFETVFLDRPFVIFGNRSAINQIIMNCVTNSIYAVKNKKGSIKISLSANDNLAELSIQDNGSGIPEDLLNNVFEPFYTTKSEDDGTGLGLSVVKRLATLLQAKINVDSKIDVGTTFTFIFKNIIHNTKQDFTLEQFLAKNPKILIFDQKNRMNDLTKELNEKQIPYLRFDQELNTFEEIKNRKADILIMDGYEMDDALVDLINVIPQIDENTKIILVTNQQDHNSTAFFSPDSGLHSINKQCTLEEIISIFMNKN